MITQIAESNFIGNRHMQVAGIPSGAQYEGSLIRYINLAESGNRFLPLLSISDCKFSDNRFLGGENSALISIQNGMLQAI
jgi:hypothetical protein